MINNELEKLLRYDLDSISFKLGFSMNTPTTLELADIAKLLNFAYIRSKSKIVEENRISFYIIALILEHVGTTDSIINSYITKILINLGLIPNANSLTSDDRVYSSGGYLSDLFSFVEIQRNSVKVSDDFSIELSEFQKLVWDKIDTEDIIGISAETSAGKSFVMLNKILDLIENNKGNIVYIAPTNSLVNQIHQDLVRLKKEMNINVSVHSHIVNISEYNEKNIFVLTQEKALSAIDNSEALNSFGEVVALIVDEIQNIERTEDSEEERAHILFDVINEFRFRIKPQKTIVAGPRIKNIDSLVKQLLDNGIGVENNIPTVLHLTYSIRITKNGVELTQHCPLVHKQLKNVFNSKGANSVINYTGNDLNNQISYIRNKFNDEPTVVFAPTAISSRKIANSLVGVKNNRKEIESLIEYTGETVHPSFQLANTLNNGIAYHHGKMPMHIRYCLEHAIKNSWIDTVVCTTTLMQGINMPVKNIIVNNNRLSQRETVKSKKLTSYEFTNLRGRAGRMMVDFIGRTFVLDEEYFQDDEDFFSGEPQKKVKVTHADKFEMYENEILEALFEDQSPYFDCEYNDLLTYIRHMLIKYNDSTSNVLNKIGIEISNERLRELRNKLDKLDVPVDIILDNRYWDPIDLNKLYLKRFNRVPTSPHSYKYETDMKETLKFLKTNANYYYKKYYNASRESTIDLNIRTAKLWSLGSPLNKILMNVNDDDGEELIDKVLDTINSTISFKIPKLIRPVVQMSSVQSTAISSLESGVIGEELYDYLKLGIPRETAIRLNNKFRFKSGSNLIELLNYRVKDISYWDRIQIQHLF